MRNTRSRANKTDKPIDPEIQNMVMLFRVSDLQAVLSVADSIRHSGKAVLQNRVLDLVKNGNQPIIDAIKKTFNQNQSIYAPKDLQKPANNPAKTSDSVIETPITNNMYQQHLPVAIPDGNRAQMHTNGVVVQSYQPNVGGYPVHPDVRLKKLAFFDVLATLLKPSTLVPNNQSNRVQESTFYFHLTPQQATDIASNRDIRNGSKIEHTIQVQLRFCLLETTCEQEDYFPPNVVVKVNNKLCNLPNPIPTNKPGVEPKRPPRPVNITPNVKLSPTVPNHIAISWCTEFNRGFVISVYLVRKLTHAQLLHRLKTKGVKPADFTRGLIKEKLTEDADSEIATTMLKVSLICPLGKMRMTTPSRASTCSHLQCFDASLYLQMNERKPTWNCPVCDKAAVYETLVVDGYFQEVLASHVLTSDDSEIQLHKDGSWSTHVMRNDTQILDTPRKSMANVEVILDDLEVVSADPPKASIKPAVNSNNEPSSTTNDTVDLTLSDSDEDDLPLRRKVAAKPMPVVTKSKGNDSNNSIIMLDSPSPPSSPNPLPSSIDLNSVTSSTTPTSSHVPLPVLDGTNFQINPLAINHRNENHDNFNSSTATSLNNELYQRLYPTAGTSPTTAIMDTLAKDRHTENLDFGQWTI